MAGVPPLQRVSAHVVPKLLADDDEKTTIDPQWDDGSTTREQHKVSKKLQAIGAGVPHRMPNVVPQAFDALAAAPSISVATLLVVKGPDMGLSAEIHSGKACTVGRSLDSDVVLTDIAVSRKHFDLRNEDGWWILADRGSGNGTLVNGELRSHAFQLVNGDLIEIGTTVLRFDARSTDVESEVSTISGRRPPMPYDAAPQSENAVYSGDSRGIESPPDISPNLSRLPEVSPASIDPRSLFELADARLPRLPTRPLALGPHAPTLMGIDAALRLPQRPVEHSSGTGAAPSAPPAAPAANATASAQAAPAARAAPQSGTWSARTKIIVVASTVSLVAVVAIAVASTRERKPVAVAVATPAAQPQRAKFTLPVSDLKAPAATGKAVAKTAAPAVPGAAAAAATTAKPIPSPAKPAPVATSAAAVPPSPAEAKPVAAPLVASVAKAQPTSSSPPATATSALADDDVDAVVETKVKVSRSKPEKRTGSKRVPVDLDSAEAKASSLYRAGKFSEAADVLRSFARTADSATKRNLEGKAASYAAFGKAYTQGMTSNNAVSAFAHLRSATKYDQTLGGAFDDELNGRMKQIAPKAAVAYIAADKSSEAHVAVEVAERVGASNDSNVVVVRQKLESAAAKLYAEAMKDLSDNPSEAKDKFRQIKSMVDAKSQWYEKASKQL